MYGEHQTWGFHGHFTGFHGDFSIIPMVVSWGYESWDMNQGDPDSKFLENSPDKKQHGCENTTSLVLFMGKSSN